MPQVSPKGLAAGLSTPAGNIKSLKHSSTSARPHSPPRSPAGRTVLGDGRQPSAKWPTLLGLGWEAPPESQLRLSPVSTPIRLNTLSTPYLDSRLHHTLTGSNPCTVTLSY